MCVGGFRPLLYKVHPIPCEGWTFGRPSNLPSNTMTYLSVAKSLARWVPACVWAALLIPGCAITAPATAWKPAEIDVEGLHKLAVLDFTGENGAAVSASVTTRLWENGFYALVDQTELQPVRMASAVNPVDVITPADYLDSARTRAVDGIIVGDVIEYRCDDQVLTNTDIHVGTNRAEDLGHGGERGGVDVGVSQNQTVHREATVSIAFRLVEVETGDVRATRKTTHSFQGDFAAGGSGHMPAKGEILDELTQECVNEFIAMLAPQEVELLLPLARSHLFQGGQALVGKGNDFARRGRWEEAMASWRQALQKNPTNDAALYNLAVAHAAQHEYTPAEDFAIQALNLKHKQLYADGLDQIRRLASDHEQTLRQRQRANLSDSASRRRLYTASR